jgi:hypothetical protein
MVFLQSEGVGSKSLLENIYGEKVPSKNSRKFLGVFNFLWELIANESFTSEMQSGT